MSLKSVAFALAVFVSVSSVQAQAWKDAYDRALSAVHTQDWAAAQTAFQEAVAVRPEDQASPTVLPGPVTEPVKWRNGAPYSPNFGVAYCAYKVAMKAADPDKRALLTTAAGDFETLVAKGQISSPTLFFLNDIYNSLGEPDKQRELGDKVKGGITWKVDTSILTPEEAGQIGAIAGATAGATGQPGVTVSGAGTGPKITVVDSGNATLTPLTSLAGPVPVVETKFALIIGNSETQMSSGGLPFASSDAMVIRDALVQNAGYGDKNVDVVVNATADQMRTSAKAIASRMPNKNATLLIYFTGIGVNVDGKDYYAGIDAAMSTDTSKMIAKEEILSIFRGSGASVFAFHQANRQINAGRYFGMEAPIFGHYAFCQATSPGEMVYAIVVDGKLTGAYTKAFADVLANFRSNRIPINEFSWTVYQSMQGGDYVTSGSGTKQVPSLPVMYQLGQDAWF